MILTAWHPSLTSPPISRALNQSHKCPCVAWVNNFARHLCFPWVGVNIMISSPATHGHRWHITRLCLMPPSVIKPHRQYRLASSSLLLANTLSRHTYQGQSCRDAIINLIQLRVLQLVCNCSQILHVVCKGLSTNRSQPDTTPAIVRTCPSCMRMSPCQTSSSKS